MNLVPFGVEKTTTCQPAAWHAATSADMLSGAGAPLTTRYSTPPSSATRSDLPGCLGSSRRQQITPGPAITAPSPGCGCRSDKGNPAGTGEDLIAAVGHQFHRDHGVVIRAVLPAVDRHSERQVTGIPAEERRPAKYRGRCRWRPRER